jgi:hypothetical protein
MSTETESGVMPDLATFHSNAWKIEKHSSNFEMQEVLVWSSKFEKK